MNKTVLLALFAVLAVFQLAVPGSIVVRSHRVLTTAEPFKFQMRPFDPGDPFRGNYLQLAFEQENAPAFRSYFSGTAYVSVAVGEDGFAKVTGVTDKRPRSGAYFRAAKQYDRLTFPFNRFFINESQARQAEALVRDAQRDQTARDSYALVRVGQGDALLEDLYVHGKPLRQALAR